MAFAFVRSTASALAEAGVDGAGDPVGDSDMRESESIESE
jgi:hypothetical protein